MSTQPELSEHTLSTALSELADEAGAPDEFRRRLMSDLDGRRGVRSIQRLRPMLAVAASVLVIAAVSYALAVRGGHRPVVHPAHPQPVNPYVVATYTGTGNGVRSVPTAIAPAGRESTIRISCQGPGKIRVNTYRVNSCNGTSTAAASDGHRRTPPRLHIVTAPGVRWRISVVFAINYRTNGIVETPADPFLANDANSLAHQSGTGTHTVHLPRPGSDPPTGVRVIVACTGAGITLSSPDTRFDDQYTHTCEPDTSFAFDIAHVRLPSTFTVTAVGTTSWQLVVIGS